MSVRLDDTTAAEVGMAISAERFRQGSSAVGRVLTLVIIADEANQADAVRAAAEAAREHPCRILTAIPRPGRGPARLDAEITVGGADGVAASLRERASLRLAFGAATWPHQLVRVMLLEQIYRAFRSQILADGSHEERSPMYQAQLAEAVEASPTATSFHLKELDRAGLIHATRDGRFVRYAVHVDGMRKLLTYLTEDCCQGQPELCGTDRKSTRLNSSHT